MSGEGHETKVTTKTLPCVVCGQPVQILEGMDPSGARCILHYFDEDVTEEWEADE